LFFGIKAYESEILLKSREHPRAALISIPVALVDTSFHINLGHYKNGKLCITKCN